MSVVRDGARIGYSLSAIGWGYTGRVDFASARELLTLRSCCARVVEGLEGLAALAEARSLDVTGM